MDFDVLLAWYPGNQLSIVGLIAGYDNHTYLKPFDRLKEIKSIKKVVYAIALNGDACEVYNLVTGEKASTLVPSDNH